MKKNRALYKPLTFNTPNLIVGNRVIILHISGHPTCTPNHPVLTSPITKVYKNGRFHTKDTIWTLATPVNR